VGESAVQLLLRRRCQLPVLAQKNLSPILEGNIAAAQFTRNHCYKLLVGCL